MAKNIRKFLGKGAAELSKLSNPAKDSKFYNKQINFIV